MQTSPSAFAAGSITALILAGGRGARMGGVDKGLQLFSGQTLVQHTLERLHHQTGALVGRVLINANRNLPTYQLMAGANVQVCTDAEPDAFAGPLAGILTGLQQCATPWLLTVPCDTPLFPLDLAQRLAHAALQHQADIAMAMAPDADSGSENNSNCSGKDDNKGGSRNRPQPVFCLLRASLATSLATYMHSGGRKIDAWTTQHAMVTADFDQTHDNPRAFANANTLAELHALEQPGLIIPS